MGFKDRQSCRIGRIKRDFCRCAVSTRASSVAFCAGTGGPAGRLLPAPLPVLCGAAWVAWANGASLRAEGFFEACGQCDEKGLYKP